MTRDEMLQAVDVAYYMTHPANGTTTLHDTIYALRRLMEVVHALIPPEDSGGAVFGPGTNTPDSIPARLSNGEHWVGVES